MSSQHWRIIFVVGMMIINLSGCASFGPKTISPDRIDYIQEIGESWKKQMLLNIVKLRYFDPPTFLDVSSIINQYGLESQINADARWYWPASSITGSSAGTGGYSRYSDKPTITYTPLSGQKFTKNLLTPIPPVAVISLVQSGWPIDMIFSFAVKTVNGVNNDAAMLTPDARKEDFEILIKSLRSVQLAGVSDIRLEKIDDKESVVFVIADGDQKEKYNKEVENIHKVLKIKSKNNTYRITYGSLAKNEDEIALLTRSVLEIMLEMGSMVEVPRKHLEKKWVKESVPISGSNALVHIYSGRDKPAESYAAIKYQEHWFWIDSGDINSKRNFALLMIFMSLTESDQKTSGPLLTI